MHDHLLDDENQEIGKDVVSELVHQDRRFRVVDDQSQQDGRQDADDVQLHDRCAAEDGQKDTGIQNGIPSLEIEPGTLFLVRHECLAVRSLQAFRNGEGNALVLYQHGH